MPLLPVLAVVFVGIGGGDSAKLDHQIHSLLHKDARVEQATVSPAELRTLTHHADGCKQIVRKLHVEGVVGGELIEGHGRLTLRMVVYDGDGGMKDLIEWPLSARALAKADIEALRSNLIPDVVDLAGAGGGGGTSDGSNDGSGDDDGDGSNDEPAPAPAPPPMPALARMGRHERAPTAAPAEVPDAPASSSDDDHAHKAAPTTTADSSDSVGPEESLENTSTSLGGADTDASEPDPALRMRASIGIGLASRSFAPGPSTVAAYGSSPVGAVHLEAQIQPSTRTALSVLAERSLGMTTPLMDGAAPTTMERWQVSGAYAMTTGTIQVAPVLGLGSRSFSIDSKDPSRSPDGQYKYVVVGAAASAALGSRLTLGAQVALQPVFGGAEPTEMAFGEASRWGFEAGASVEMRPRDHLFVRATADYQTFSWSWNAAGARGAGGAVDSYPSGTLSLGADY